MIQLIDGVIVLSGADVLINAALLDRGVQLTSRRDASTLSPEVIEHVRTIKRAASEYRARMSEVGQGPRTSELIEAPSALSIGSPQEITAREAADILGVSDRHVRRIAAELGLLRTNPMIFDRSLVEAYALARAHKRSAA